MDSSAARRHAGPTRRRPTDGCVGSCGRAVAAPKILCSACWPKLPTHLQRAVMRRKRMEPGDRFNLLLDVEAHLRTARSAR
ncbi:hypothetical protein [Kineococcus terrestris]|uniref:hypothetical protein n=1 Tax=Kineococcus terrestris TaxID=2044856 RepID=UPI0034DAFB1D